METIKYVKGDLITGNGCSLKGSITASYYDLEMMFGEPVYEGIGDKITTEFSVNYEAIEEDGNVLTGNFRVYVWYFSWNLNDSSVTTQWNIGGHDITDFEAAQQAQSQYEDTDIRYSGDTACLLDGELVCLS
jgi:hypothetical protein